MPLLAGAVLLTPAGTGNAHSPRLASDGAGLPIANLSHGQLDVMARHRAAILALAGRQARPDLKTRTLANFANLQFVYCFWGLVAGSLKNEDNPFNECSHSYLAASKALLDHLQTVETGRAEALSLAKTISMEMLNEPSALQMCRNGATHFNTAEVIMPRVANIAINPIIGVAGFVALGAFGGLLVAGRRRRSAKSS